MKEVSEIQQPTPATVKDTGDFVVAIGASAGGLEAIHEFFDNIPDESSLAYVVIQHLSPDYKSLLVELVSKHTHMQVLEARHDMSLRSNCVYIIPNNKLMTIDDNRLKLADKVHEKAPNTAIDTFLTTLAQQKRDKAIAIILSGTGTDGTKGIEAIKECGGMVIVQDPGTAKFDGMPNSAITSGNADFILPPAKMHEELLNYTREEQAPMFDPAKVSEGVLDEIFKLVYQHSGHDFNLYKTPTILRRISRRMNATGYKRPKEYLNFLHDNPQEAKVLGKEFLIGVTKFFRDKGAFDCLAQQVIPDIINKKAEGELLKVWICACSTGEEAYSVAILINDYLQQVRKNLDVKIFATDIDQSSIEIASKNQYSAASVKEIDQKYLDRYFVKEGKYYSVISPIRKQIVFAKHNVTKAPPFIKNDLVTCRNMLIYMNSLLQQKVLSTFHFSLNPGGYLFLGSSETAGILKDGVVEVNSKWKIFKKTGNINYAAHNTYNTGSQQVNAAPKSLPPFKLAEKPEQTTHDNFRDFLVDELGYVGIFIDRYYEIKETVGDFKKYLSLPEKKLDLNILKMVPREVSVILNTAIRKAWKDNQVTHLKKLRIQHNKRELFLNIAVKPGAPNGNQPYTLVVFSETKPEGNTGEKESTVTYIPSEQQNEYVLELEAELNETRSNLQMAVEEMETTNEELQSSNEELLSANEELQSSNEELQSLNEELHTLNTEHQLKIKELIELNDDLNNYFKSTDIGQLFLDANLRIRKFNPAAVKLINLIQTDVGRPLSHISTNIKSENLAQDIARVQHTGETIEKEVTLKNGSRSLMRIMPYVRKDKQNDGIVISFVDITLISELNNIITGVFNASISSILAFKAVRNSQNQITDFRCVAANNAASTLLGRKENELVNALLKDVPELNDSNLFEKYVWVTETGNNFQDECPLNQTQWFQIVAVKMGDGIAVTFTDTSDRKQAEQKLRKNYQELIVARESLKKLNTELEHKVKERTRELTESEERFTLVAKATNDTIWDWNLVNNKMWRSDNFTSMFGYHRNEETQSIGFWFSKIHPDDRKRVEASVYDAINNNKKQWSAEYRLLKADNKYAIILDRGSILHDEYNTPYRMVGSIVDITRLIEAEKKMNTSENRFKKVFESNMIGMIFSNLNGDIVDANNAFLSMIGYTEADLHNNKLNANDITPPEYDKVTRWATAQLKEHGVSPPFEKEYIKKDGSRITVLMGSALLEDDYTAEAVTYIINITEQKEIEKKRKELQGLIKKQQDEFQSIFMNAPALITIRRGSQLRYDFVNNAFIDFYGRRDYLGKTAEEVHITGYEEHLKEIEQTVLQSGESYIGRAFKIERLDPVSHHKVDCWLDFIYTPVYADNGQIDGIAFFGFDVSDLVKAQQATRQLMQKKDEFMSIASHELKTPITSLKGSLQIIQRLAGKNTEVKKIYSFIDKASKQTSRLTTLVDDLLDVTRIQQGKMMFNYTRFDAAEAIAECVEEAQASITSHKIEILGNPVVEIYADRPRLEQVISNFLSNAIKYSPDANRVEVSAEVTDNGMLRVSVRDFGIGIPQDKRNHVFDRFFRVQESSHKFSGLGLGLYISAEIVYRHDGKIGVESTENEGSTFWFCIPVERK